MGELAGIGKELLGKLNEIEDDLGLPRSYSADLPRSYNAEDARKIVWHPYPEEKPSIKTLEPHLVTRKGLVDRDICYTDVVIYDGMHGEFIEYDEDIIAWAEMPKPYKTTDKKIIITIECDMDIYNELRTYPDYRLRFVGRSTPIEEDEK